MSDVPTKSQMRRLKIQSPGLFTESEYCHDCQIARGGKEPRHGLNGVTCIKGTCRICRREDQFLIYNCDYDWPKTGEKAVWD